MRVAFLASPSGAGLNIVAFGFCVIIAHGALTAGVGAELDGARLSPTEFLPRYRQALRELEACYRNAQIDGRESTYKRSASLPIQGASDTSQKPPRERGFRGFFYVFSEPNEKLWLTNAKYFNRLKEPKLYIDSVIVSAGSHQFMVSRRAPGGPYFLVRSENGTVIPYNVQTFRHRVKNAPYCLAGFPDFVEYVNSPQFHVTEVSNTTDSGRALTKVVFEYAPNDFKKPNMEGWLRLETSFNWVIRDYEISVTHTKPGQPPIISHISGSVDYRQEQGTPIPIRIKYDGWDDFSTKKKRFFEDTLYELDRFALGATPSEDFSLAAFGLGDFERPSARASNRIPYYLVVGALVALLISAALARIARLYRNRNSESTAHRAPECKG